MTKRREPHRMIPDPMNPPMIGDEVVEGLRGVRKAFHWEQAKGRVVEYVLDHGQNVALVDPLPQPPRTPPTPSPGDARAAADAKHGHATKEEAP